MRYIAAFTTAVVFLAAAPAFGLESRAYQLREDFGRAPLYDCTMNYYYYIPCPTYSWFFGVSGWAPGQVLGAWFRVGDPSMGTSHGCPPYGTCDPAYAQTLTQFRVLDFAGYGTVYISLFTVEFDVWCCDEQGCPVGPSLWTSGPFETHDGWNYITLDPPLSVASCNTVSDPPSYPRFLITATHVGSQPTYPNWGFDAVSKPLSYACQMHDVGSCPALYPRPSVSHYDVMHSGDYGIGFANCPPRWIPDPGDPTGSAYGYIELAWRIYMPVPGPAPYDISGFVRDQTGQPVAEATMALAGGVGGSTATDSSGYYAFWNLTAGLTYTVTPSKTDCDFHPVSRTYPNLSQNWINQNYTAHCGSAGVPPPPTTTWGAIKAIFK